MISISRVWFFSLVIFNLICFGRAQQNPGAGQAVKKPCYDQDKRPGFCADKISCPKGYRELFDSNGKLRGDLEDYHNMCKDISTTWICCYTENSWNNMDSVRSSGYQNKLESMFSFAPLGPRASPTITQTSSSKPGGIQSSVSYPLGGGPSITNNQFGGNYLSSYPYGAKIISTNQPPSTSNPTQDPLLTPYAFRFQSSFVPPTPATPTKTCGISSGTSMRVVGGSPAKVGAYPWLAALGYTQVNTKSLAYLCGGTLISASYIITAGHCINSNLVKILLGFNDISKDEEGRMEFGIKKIVVHPEFNPNTIINDLALVQLASKPPISNLIRPICLPEDDSFKTRDYTGMNPFIAGLGATAYQKSTTTRVREVQVPIVDTKECQANYSKVFPNIKFTEKMMCAGSYLVDACQGDSGGPLMLPQVEGSFVYYYLLGCVSYGNECAKPGFPGVYTKVPFYMDWIKANIIES